jgi:hypothetical protein
VGSRNADGTIEDAMAVACGGEGFVVTYSVRARVEFIGVAGVDVPLVSPP